MISTYRLYELINSVHKYDRNKMHQVYVKYNKEREIRRKEKKDRIEIDTHEEDDTW